MTPNETVLKLVKALGIPDDQINSASEIHLSIAAGRLPELKITKFLLPDKATNFGQLDTETFTWVLKEKTSE